ncbi:hypothetical protein ASZ90_015448 [hydrocarbon metagenome]|uniref:Uncharacterized protein n=1 Tax=hydrocarbon metagenome TaxID=938273 RepID=A0A0W8F1X9_9ZZZZ
MGIFSDVLVRNPIPIIPPGARTGESERALSRMSCWIDSPEIL